MTIEEWVRLEKEHIDRFMAWWKEHEGDKELFPPELPAGEWDEQYRSWAY